MYKTTDCNICMSSRLVVFIIIMYRKMQSVGATLKFDPNFFLFERIIHTILVTFSKKISWACTGMMTCENDLFKFS